MPTFQLGSANQRAIIISRNSYDSIRIKDLTFLVYVELSFSRGLPLIAILKYSDDLQYRQAIEKQLNKVEGSNKFSKAVSFGHSQEFIQSEKEDQEIAEACRRLIKNAVVCWNYLYLSRELATEKNEERRAELIEAIRDGSVATWKHLNLHGSSTSRMNEWSTR